MFDSPTLKTLVPPLAEFLKNPQLNTGVFNAHRARGDTKATRPSFADCMDRKIRRDRIFELSSGEPSLAKLLRRKKWVDAFLSKNNFPYVHVIHEDFQLQQLGKILTSEKEGVVKPLFSTNSWGVFPYSKTSEDKLIDLRSGVFTSTNLILQTLHNDMQRYMFPNRWRIEELMRPANKQLLLPDDFKIYCFYGCSPLILQVRRSKESVAYKFYDESGISVDVGKYDTEINDQLVLCENYKKMISIAEQIIIALKIPFLRIDMYSTNHGPIVGELTPEPGGYQKFSTLVDTYLGIQWELAELRLSLHNKSFIQ